MMFIIVIDPHTGIEWTCANATGKIAICFLVVFIHTYTHIHTHVLFHTYIHTHTCMIINVYIGDSMGYCFVICT